MDTVQHGHNVSQQKEVFARQEVEQPEREHYYHTPSPTDAPQNTVCSVTFQKPEPKIHFKQTKIIQRKMVPTSGWTAVSPLLPQSPSLPSIAHTDPHTTGCRGCSAESPACRIKVAESCATSPVRRICSNILFSEEKQFSKCVSHSPPVRKILI